MRKSVPLVQVLCRYGDGGERDVADKSEEGDYLSYGFPMGKPKYLKEAVDALYEYSKEKKRKFQMHNVTPEQFALLEEIYREDFRSNTHRDYADYVYGSRKACKIIRKEISWKEESYEQVQKLYPNWRYERLNDSNVEEMFSDGTEMEKQNGCGEDPERTVRCV